jgi:hypothetical protein
VAENGRWEHAGQRYLDGGAHGTGPHSRPDGSPWENPWVESYGSRIRDELLAIEQFDTLLEAQVLIADWRIEYNTYRPHSALDGLTPAEFADQWRRTTNHSSHNGRTNQRGPVSGGTFRGLHALICSEATGENATPSQTNSGPSRAFLPNRSMNKPANWTTASPRVIPRFGRARREGDLD